MEHAPAAPRTTTIEALADRLRSFRSPEGAKTEVIAIDGRAGAGKTTLADRLAVALGGATIVHTDDFASHDEPIEWYGRVVSELLVPLVEGRTAEFVRYDWRARRFTDRVAVAPGTPVLLEGVSASRRAFQPYLACRIWVEAPSAVREQRMKRRDGSSPDYDQAAAEAGEVAFVEREKPDATADIIVAGDFTGPDILVLR